MTTILNEYRKTLSALKSLTARFLVDFDFDKFGEDQVAEAVNDACMDFALRTQAVKDEINLLVSENKHIYDIKAFILEANTAASGTRKEFGFIKRVGFSGTDEPAFMPTSSHEVNFTNASQFISQGLYVNRFFVDLLSPGKLQIFPPDADGTALPSESGNLQVLYIGLPDYMDDPGDYPDSMIAPQFHDAIAIGAAAMLLYEGNETDVKQADILDQEFTRLCMMAVMNEYDGQTNYQGARPA